MKSLLEIFKKPLNHENQLVPPINLILKNLKTEREREERERREKRERERERERESDARTKLIQRVDYKSVMAPSRAKKSAGASGSASKAKEKGKGKGKGKGKAVMEYSIEEDTGHWIPLYEDESMQPYVARVEYAKSGRANCRLCCEKIEKATPKVGLPMKWQGGKNIMAAPYGWATSWAHPFCVRVKAEGGRKALEKKVRDI